MAIHKETFFQDYSDEQGIPSHWVVQYYIDNKATFPEARYFKDGKEALEFERKIKNGE